MDWMLSTFMPPNVDQVDKFRGGIMRETGVERDIYPSTRGTWKDLEYLHRYAQILPKFQ